MSRRFFAPLVALLLAPAALAQENILILLADDVGVDNIGCYGEGLDLPATPVIDSLAAQGLMFRNAWANPLCSQTRASIETGRFAIHNGMGEAVENELVGSLKYENVTLPEMLDKGTGFAYAHGFFGKWHMSTGPIFTGGKGGWPNAPNDHGWSHFQGQKANLPAGESFYQYTKVTNGKTSVSTKYSTSDGVDDALAWIATTPEPWLAYVAVNSPHSPYHTPPADLYSVDLTRAGPVSQQPRPYYKAAIEALDSELGRLLDELGPRLDHTVVLFLGDNGTPKEVLAKGIPRNQAKGSPFEGGINVPLILARPGSPRPPGAGGTFGAKGVVSDALVTASDVFATVAEIAGVDLAKALPPGYALDSISFLPYLDDPTLRSARLYAYSELFAPNGVGISYDFHLQIVREARYKLIRLPPFADSLIDLLLNPAETVNLLTLPNRGSDALLAYDRMVSFLATL